MCMQNMAFRIVFSFFIIVIFGAGALKAEEIGECPTTPEIWTMGILPDPKQSNDLTKSYDSFGIAEGKKIIIKGRLQDANCVPIAGATVSIWQMNDKGVYQFEEDNNDKSNDEYFRSSGKYITDNKGNYEFITIYPGTNDDTKPYIILKIMHENFLPLQTMIFFPEFDNQASIKGFNKEIQKNQIHLIVAENIGKQRNKVVYYFPVSLGQTSSYKEY
ncbi:MAG: protocatechuate 3,4-dioxygenase beta subunit [Candidatus Midichloriaceae bacterium]|jgi:protocatechuate 3,4-dioxygenase beta subunit